MSTYLEAARGISEDRRGDGRELRTVVGILAIATGERETDDIAVAL